MLLNSSSFHFCKQNKTRNP